MWQALRLVRGWEVKDEVPNEINQLAVQWLENKMQQTLEGVEKSMSEFRLSEALKDLYRFIWGDFCSWYLEMIKPAYGEAIDRTTLLKTIEFFEELMTILHPFMPFVTEEIWHELKERKAGEDCVVSSYPSIKAYDADLIAKVEKAKDVTSKVRETRNSKGISQKEALQLFVQESDSANALFSQAGLKDMIVKMANLSALNMTSEDDVASSLSFISATEKYFLEVNLTIDVEAECARLKEELAYQEGFVAKVGKKLSNERFVNNAPAAVVEKERKKMADGEERIKILKESLAQLGGQ